MLRVLYKKNFHVSGETFIVPLEEVNHYVATKEWFLLPEDALAAEVTTLNTQKNQLKAQHAQAMAKLDKKEGEKPKKKTK